MYPWVLGVDAMHHTPDGMGADRYNERQNMRQAAHARQQSTNWAVVNWTTFNPIQDDFDSREEAEAWLDEAKQGYPQPEWLTNDDEIRIADIG